MPIPKFKNESYTNWATPEDRKKQQDAITALEAKLGAEYPNIIGGERVTAANKLKSLNPSNPDQVVGVFQKGTPDSAVLALNAAPKAFETWRYVDPEKRAGYLFKAAQIMRKRRYELNAAEILEVGKSWPEADADVAEAIDFLEFYGREMIRYAAAKPAVQLPGEKDELVYLPLGVGVVIPPWNFPLAILAGMASAAIVTGNTVVLKPSSDSPLVGYKFMEDGRSGPPSGCHQFRERPRRRGREYARNPSEDQVHRLHGFEGSRNPYQHGRFEGSAGPDLAQADRGGDGREGLDHRRPRNRPRRGGGGRHRFRVRFPGAEMFRLLAGDRG